MYRLAAAIGYAIVMLSTGKAEGSQIPSKGDVAFALNTNGGDICPSDKCSFDKESEPSFCGVLPSLNREGDIFTSEGEVHRCFLSTQVKPEALLDYFFNSASIILDIESKFLSALERILPCIKKVGNEILLN